MRSILTQDHATNLRDLILNYDLDKPGHRIIDFTYGKGSLWKTKYKYSFELTKTDAVPTGQDVIKRDLFEDNYDNLHLHEAGIFDPPYKYGKAKVFDYSNKSKKAPILSAQAQGPNSWATESRFSENKNPSVFIARIKALNAVALQVLKPGALLFCKVMDTRHNGNLIDNHFLLRMHLQNFKLFAIYVYLAGGSKTWKHDSETSHGYWMVFKMTADPKQKRLPGCVVDLSFKR